MSGGSNINTGELRRGILKGVEVIVNELEKMAMYIEGVDVPTLRQVALIS